MVTIEQVEKLREHANISYDEATTALENANGDILQAIIDLERQGKIKAPAGGGQYKSGSIEVSINKHKEQSNNGKERKSGKDEYDSSAFSRSMRRFGRWLLFVIHKGNINTFVVNRNDSEIMRLPITVLVLLLLFAFWIAVPLMIVGFFFNCRYSFKGPDIRDNMVNDAMDTVADAAQEIKDEMKKDNKN